jgi:hypothetical protein
VELAGDAVVERVVAGHDGDRRLHIALVGPQAIEKAEAVDERHPQVDDDRVGSLAACLLQSRLGVERGADFVTLEPQHARKRLRHGQVVVDNQDF